MTIRTAAIADLPRMERAAQSFYATSKFLRGFDIRRFTNVWAALLEAGTGVIFLAEADGEIVGALGGVEYPDLYSGAAIATEFFWFVREEHRGGGLKLYRAFEDWARERKCSAIRMVHLLDSMPEKLERVYRHLGFEPCEVHYQKELKTT